jgi:hypothetical protein
MDDRTLKAQVAGAILGALAAARLPARCDHIDTSDGEILASIALSLAEALLKRMGIDRDRGDVRRDPFWPRLEDRLMIEHDEKLQKTILATLHGAGDMIAALNALYKKVRERYEALDAKADAMRKRADTWEKMADSLYEALEYLEAVAEDDDEADDDEAAEEVAEANE